MIAHPDDSVAIAATNGSSDFHDAILMVLIDNKGAMTLSTPETCARLRYRANHVIRKRRLLSASRRYFGSCLRKRDRGMPTSHQMSMQKQTLP